MDYGELSRDLVANAFQNQLPGMTVSVVLHFLIAQGDYDAESGTYNDTVIDSDPIPCVAGRPTFDEVSEGQAVATDIKLLVPGKLVTQEINAQTTATVNGKKFTVHKGKDVPGGSIHIVFIRLT